MKANHNEQASVSNLDPVGNNNTKNWNWKQITTKARLTFKDIKLVTIIQRTEIESKSQPKCREGIKRYSW